MKRVTIRAALKEDVPAIVALNREGLKPYRWAYDTDYIRRAVGKGNYYVICNSDKILGCIKFYLERSWLWVSTMVVAKDCRGRGYGSLLINFAEKSARRKDYNRVRLDTLTISRVGKFYKKMGFELVDEGPYYGRRYQIYEKRI